MKKLYVCEVVVIGEGKTRECVEATNLKDAIIKLKMMYETFEHKTVIITYCSEV